jgi:hypothetical protein
LIGCIQLQVEREEEEERTSRCVWELAVFIAGLLTMAAQQKKSRREGDIFVPSFNCRRHVQSLL